MPRAVQPLATWKKRLRFSSLQEARNGFRNSARVGGGISRHVVVQGGGRLLSCGANTSEYRSFKTDDFPPLFDAMQSRAVHRDFRLRAKPCAKISVNELPRFCATQYEWHGRCSDVFGARVSRYGACGKSIAKLEGEFMQSTIEQIPGSNIAKNAGLCRNTLRSLLMIAGLFAMTVPFAHAGAELRINDEASVSVGLGIRASFTSLENGAPDGTSDSKTIAADNVRLYMAGQFNKYLK